MALTKMEIIKAERHRGDFFQASGLEVSAIIEFRDDATFRETDDSSSDKVGGFSSISLCD